MSCKAFDCSISVSPELEANPDVSGIGVVISFVASGWATLLLLILRYIAETSNSSTNNDLAMLDRSVRKAIRRVLKTWTPSPRWVPTLEKIVLAMSDQQLVTGLSIIISAYSRLRCGLSFYHWKLIAMLAWFSSVVHLATLLFLQDYLQQNRRVWYVRVFLMTALAVMLSVALVPTAFPPVDTSSGYEFDPPELPGMPAWCSFNSITAQKLDAENGTPMVFSQIILLGGLLIRLTGMSLTTNRLLGSSPRSVVGIICRRFLVGRCDKLQRSSTFNQALFMPLVVFSLSFLISMQALLDFLGSDICSVLWLLFSLAWGTMRLFDERRVTEENEWEFGQLVPVLLLLLPALLMLEGFCLMETQTNLQPIPLQAINRDSSPGLGVNPLPEDPSDGLYSRFRHLCNQDFKAEPWYLDNLLLIMSYSATTACFILGLQLGLKYAVYLYLGPCLCSGFIIIPGAIPLCEIMSGIRRRGKHFPFLIKLAVDPRKKYRISRWIFCVWGPISAVIFVADFNTRFVGYSTYLVILWIVVWGIICFYAFFSGLFSIYSQVRARNQPIDYMSRPPSCAP